MGRGSEIGAVLVAAPDLAVWAGCLAQRIAATPTYYQGHEDVPEDAALALVEALKPEDLRRFADALLEVVPGLAERMTDAVLTELCEEIARREDPKHAHATVELVKAIEQDWRNQA